MIGALNNADNPQALITKALALHPVIKIGFPSLNRFLHNGEAILGKQIRYVILMIMARAMKNRVKLHEFRTHPIHNTNASRELR